METTPEEGTIEPSDSQPEESDEELQIPESDDETPLSTTDEKTEQESEEEFVQDSETEEETEAESSGRFEIPAGFVIQESDRKGREALKSAGFAEKYEEMTEAVDYAEKELLLRSCVKNASSDIGVGVIDLEKMFAGDIEAPEISVVTPSGAKVTDFSRSLSSEDLIQFSSSYPGNQDRVLFTLDGKAPLIRNGEIIRGEIYEAGTGIPVKNLEAENRKWVYQNTGK